MKKRAVSMLLASLAVVSFILPALATDPPDIEGSEESVEIEPQSAIRLDGEPVESVEYEIHNGVCYVTVSSFVSLMEAEAMVEETYGMVSVNAAAFVGVVDVTEDGEPAVDEAGAEEPATDPAEEGELFDVVFEIEQPLSGSVEEETLNLYADIWTPYIVANGRYLYAKDGLILLNDSVAAPVRVLAQVFNLNVSYDNEEQAVLLDHQEGASAFLASGDDFYDADTLYWLSRIISAESGNQPLEGKLAVGNVVMNRVADPQFPDTIYDVLFQKNQFTPAITGSINRTPNDDSIVAAKLVMDGAEVVPTALFFSRAGMACYASRHRTYVTTIGAHAFYA